MSAPFAAVAGFSAPVLHLFVVVVDRVVVIVGLIALVFVSSLASLAFGLVPALLAAAFLFLFFLF